MTIHYSLCPENPNAHLFKVIQTVAIDGPEYLELCLPNWIPGSYMIRDFARHIVSLEALDAKGHPIAANKVGKSTWQVGNPSGPVTITYQVYALDSSIRAAYLDDLRGFANGTSVFLSVSDYEHLPCSVSLLPPPGHPDWKVATSLARQDGKEWQGFEFGEFKAKNYADLIEHPFEFGTFGSAHFDVDGVPHSVVISGHQELDWERLCTDLTKICRHHIAFFGTPAPFDRYLFMVNAVPEGYGGLEHTESTALICNIRDLPQKWRADEVNDDYRSFLGLCSHEYFHTWNVKRIRPVELVEGGLEQEVHTEQLWFYEGVTSYYDELSLLRAGIIDRQSYLELLAQTITRVLRGRGRHKQTVADSSFDTWTRFYKQDENAPNAIISYYTKGALAALCLDLSIRQHSANRFSLDSVMKAIWQQHGLTEKPTHPDTFAELALEVTGIDLSESLRHYLSTTDELPLADHLALFGVEMTLRTPTTFMDKGGKASGSPLKRWCGARFSPHPLGAKVVTVLNDSAAEQSGLTAGDIVIAIDDHKVDGASIEKTISALDVEKAHKLHLFRNNVLQQREIVTEVPDAFCCEMRIEDPAKLGDWLDVTLPS